MSPRPGSRPPLHTVVPSHGFFACLVLMLSVALVYTPDAQASTCDSLIHLTLPDTTITSATTVVAGAFTPPNGELDPRQAPLVKAAPAFCRVTAKLAPSSDSNIQIEVWMPLSGWNGRFQGTGNGGFAGSIGYGTMAVAITAGYATAGTDTGHEGSATDAGWATGHPEKLVDYGSRALHEMTLQAKAIVMAFYGKPPQHSYFSSCSNGGREALMEAQRFPADYDGIVAGAPANFFTHLVTQSAWDMKILGEDHSYIPPAKIPALASAVVAACDAQDGVHDGVLNDPPQCHFDPAKLRCKHADSDVCLNAAQVAALKKIYAGPRDSRGHQIFPGLSPGGENGAGGWKLWVTGSAPRKSLQYAFGTGFFRNMVFENPKWEPQDLNLDGDVALADKKLGQILNATDPDLKAFKNRGGKLIIYHGWSDAAIAPQNSINYFHEVIRSVGEEDANEFARLYMVPGLQHCFGGPGADSFGQFGVLPPDVDAKHNIQKAVERWVEDGAAPSEIIAVKLVNDMDPAQGVAMSRPLCPYPKMAQYKGSGDTKDAANFRCAAK